MVELEKRRLIAVLDAVGEKTLADSGTPPALIEKIKGGNYALSAQQAAAAAQSQAAQQAALKRGLEADVAAIAERNQRLTKNNAAATLNGTMLDRVTGNLVKLNGEELRSFDANELKRVQYYVIYGSAQWCGPCRTFTPKLVEFYNRMKPKHPEFEVIFASGDRSQFSMTKYMRDAKMPWPALNFESRELMRQYCGGSIPWLVVVNDKGQSISQNGKDKQYIDPDTILAQLEKALSR